LDLALHVAAGFDWFGRKVEQGAVVYVAAEAGRAILNRVAAWRIAHGLDRKDIPFAAVTSPIDLCHAAAGDVDRLIATIQGAGLGPPALLNIDTLSRTLAGGSENAPDDMGALVRSVDSLRDELRCHVQLIHHSGKDQSRGSRGHSLLRCAVDTEIETARDHITGTSTATVTKQRDGPTTGQIAFRLRQIVLGMNQDGQPVTSCVLDALALPLTKPRAKHRLPAAQARALELLKDALARHGQIPPANDHTPANTPCVSEALWRRCCYAGQIAESDKPDAKQKAFKRSAQELLTKGYIGKSDEFVWIVP
jgi:AAA domain